LLPWLQEIDANPPELPTEYGEPVQTLENVILGGIAVLVVLHLDWLLQDPDRFAWCRSKLKSISENPPPPTQFDSEVAIGDYRWDDFAAECGIRLLAVDRTDLLARKIVAQSVAGFHYNTTGMTMARAFEVRNSLGDDFIRLVTVSVRWASLRVLDVRSRGTSKSDKQDSAQRANLIQEFVDQKLSSDVSDMKVINSETLAAYDAIQQRTHPEFRARRRGGSRSPGRSREVLYPGRLGLDGHVLTHALGWLDLSTAVSNEERTRWLGLLRTLLEMVFETVPTVEDPENQEISGLPSEFDGWVYAIVSRAIPLLSPTEAAETFWHPILDLGVPAHEWVERFFWYWFTDGVRAARSPDEFVRIWRSMVLYALASPKWDHNTYGSYRLDGIVIELLGLDARWGAFAVNEAFAPALATMVDVFGRAAAQWFRMR
jgi:hypothetical protein